MQANERISNLADDGLIIAIDGPAGTGKSTVSRALAKKLGAQYLDTGAMYRIATLHVLEQGIDPQDAAAVIEATANLPVQVNNDPDSTAVYLAGRDVHQEIRGSEVSRNVSSVSAIPQVRKIMVALQRQLAGAAHRCIVEGRDIGTVVLVDAPLKIFLTASAEVRAKRRFDQNRESGQEQSYEDVLKETIRRDDLDSTRADSPLKPAADAIIVDTSEMSFDEVLSKLSELAESSRWKGSGNE